MDAQSMDGGITIDIAADVANVAVTLGPDDEGALLAAAHEMIDRAWVLLGRGADGEQTHVELRLRSGDAGPSLEAVADSFVSALTWERRRAQLWARHGATVERVVTVGAGAYPNLDTTPKAPPTTEIAGVGAEVMPHQRRRLGDDVVLSNDFCQSVLLSASDYASFLLGSLPSDSPAHAELVRAGFVASEVDEDALGLALAQRWGYLHHGPNLHVMVITLRCDHTCRYCHASRVPMARPGYDMSLETVEHVVDRIFESTNDHILIEFQGGEPLANFEAVRHTVEYARKLNAGGAKKLSFALVTNMTFMDEDKLDYLVENRVEICTSLDGPADLHNAQRLTSGGNAFAKVTRWITRVNERYEAEGLDPSLYRVEALLTLTRAALPRWREIIDTYMAEGCRAIFLRSLNPFGFAANTADSIGYPIEDWLEVYRQSVDYMIELNREGQEVLERNMAIFLTKILSGTDPNYLDIRSPCGAGIGQLAYSYDGQVFTCDEGRMVSEMGDDLFRIGHVSEDRYSDLLTHGAVRSLVMSSTLDALPGCRSCAYKPFCGLCPVHTYQAQGSLTGRVLDSAMCAKHKGIIDHAFTLIKRSRTDSQLAEILARWVTVRPKEHFVLAD